MRASTALILLSMAACTQAEVPEPARPLSYELLMGAHEIAAPLDLSVFTPSAGALPPVHSFAGRLSFSAPAGRTGSKVLHDRDDVAGGGSDSILGLPPFDFEFVQSGETVIPLRRGPQPGSHRYWEYVLEPGRAWQEPGDRGLTRAAIPFALIERNANCLHYGILAFLFGDRGSVSQVAFQVTGETCLYLKFDLWGIAEARYTPTVPEDAAAIARAYAEEVRTRLPVRPIEALRGDYPGVDPAGIGSSAEVAPADMTAFGLVIDGVHYAGGCETRHGSLPFCDVLDLPSYSLAKSIFAGLALMRLERRFPGTVNERIADYVPECRAAGGWNDVSFLHALDMTTGHYRSPGVWVDEHADYGLELHLVETHAQKIHHACDDFPRRESPGKHWVYRTADTYVLGTALNAYVKRRLGDGADLYDDVMVPDLWRPLRLSPVTSFTRRTYGTVEQPFTGWGLVLHRDDIARIAQWLLADKGVLDGQQVLDPGMLASALQQSPDDHGFIAMDAQSRYQHGFYGVDIGAGIGCADPVWVSYMAGYGGIVVALFPNGVVYYHVSDGNSFLWRRAATEVDRIRSLCSRRRTPGDPA